MVMMVVMLQSLPDRSDFEVFEAADGEMRIRFSTRDGNAEMSPADLLFEAGETEHGTKE
jgi:hypothetical protein